MSEKITKINESDKSIKEDIKPITIKLENGDAYTLEFDRETVKWAEQRGFRGNPANGYAQLTDMPITFMEDIFYYSFHMHHKTVTKKFTDDLLYNVLKGMPEGMLERLMSLHALTYETLMSNDDEGKNVGVVVEM